MQKVFGDTSKYNDIINLPHPVSLNHPQMNIGDRAAQFSPFAALTGYEEAILETARITKSKVELDESQKAALDEKLQLLCAHIQEHPTVEITYFQQDLTKAGGAYRTVFGSVKKIDRYRGVVVLADDVRIPMEDIVAMS